MRAGGELVFAFRLASHLRLTLRDVFAMSAAEFSMWHVFYQRFGFDVDRLEWVEANAGAVAAMCSVKPADLIPVFAAPDPAAKKKRLFDWLDSLKEGNTRGQQ